MHLVMFDIDGTLVETSNFEDRIFSQAVRSVLTGEIDKNWSNYKNVTDTGIIEEICKQKNLANQSKTILTDIQKAFVKLTTSYISSNPNSITEIPGALAFLNNLLQEPEVCVAVATGGWRETAFLKLEKIGVDAKSLNIATSSDSSQRTKIMEIAEYRAMGEKLSSSRTYFGDGDWDKRACDELGFDFIAIGEKVQHEKRFKDYSNPEPILKILGV